MKTKRKTIHVPEALYNRFLSFKENSEAQTNPATLELMLGLLERSHVDPKEADDALVLHLDDTKKEKFFDDSPFTELEKLELTEKELFDRASSSTDKPREWWLMPALVTGCKEIITHELKEKMGILASNARGASDSKIAEAWDKLMAEGKPFNRQRIRDLTGCGATPVQRWIETHHPELADVRKFNEN